MEGQLIRVDQLPSKGIIYPDDIEIYIKPLTIKQQMDMDRYGISPAEYYTQVVQGITIRGEFDRNNLLFGDVQFLDLVRTLYTFDTSQDIYVKDYPCSAGCGGTVECKFKLDEVACEDYPEDIFGEDGQGKMYEFSDGLKIWFAPFTIDSYIKMARKYLSGKNINMGEIYTAFMALCARGVEERVFRDPKDLFEFVREYIGDLSSYKDRKMLLEIEQKCTSVVEPITTTCPNCGEEVKVIISPKTVFQQ